MRKRICGTCRECCIHVGVKSLDKPPGVPCLHIVDNGCSGACGIYDERPSDCKAYRCGWLDGDTSDYVDRPDRSGVIFERAHFDTPAGRVVTMMMAYGSGELDPDTAERMSLEQDFVVIARDEIYGSERNIAAVMEFVAICKAQGSIGFRDGAGELTEYSLSERQT